MITNHFVSTTIKVLAANEDEAWDAGLAELKLRYSDHADSMNAEDCWPETYADNGHDRWFFVVVSYDVPVTDP